MKEKSIDIVCWIILGIIILGIIYSLSACKTNTVYVPVETIRTEYQDKFHKDSVYLHDSVMVKMKGDTVWLEKYKYLYRDKLVRDSVFISDTIQVPYPVVEYKEVNKLKSWQTFLVWCGLLSLILLAGYASFKVISKKLF